MMADNIIGIKELQGKLKKVSEAALKGRSFLVVRNSKPVFRIEPVGLTVKDKKYTINDLKKLRFKSGEKNLSKRVDDIVYGDV